MGRSQCQFFLQVCIWAGGEGSVRAAREGTEKGEGGCETDTDASSVAALPASWGRNQVCICSGRSQSRDHAANRVNQGPERLG